MDALRAWCSTGAANPRVATRPGGCRLLQDTGWSDPCIQIPRCRSVPSVPRLSSPCLLHTSRLPLIADYRWKRTLSISFIFSALCGDFLWTTRRFWCMILDMKQKPPPPSPLVVSPKKGPCLCGARPVVARGLCARCYKRWQRAGKKGSPKKVAPKPPRVPTSDETVSEYARTMPLEERRAAARAVLALAGIG